MPNTILDFQTVVASLSNFQNCFLPARSRSMTCHQREEKHNRIGVIILLLQPGKILFVTFARTGLVLSCCYYSLENLLVECTGLVLSLCWENYVSKMLPDSQFDKIYFDQVYVELIQLVTVKIEGFCPNGKILDWKIFHFVIRLWGIKRCRIKWRMRKLDVNINFQTFWY